MNHKFHPDLLLTHLSNMDFGVSMQGSHDFERSAALQRGELPEHRLAQVIQFVAAHLVDNIPTLEGQNTFQGLGMIAMFTPGKL